VAKLSKATNRDRKIKKRKYGMRVDGKSVFVIKNAQKKRAVKIKQLRKEKEELLNQENVR
jgi:predicted metalloprotease